MMANKASGVKPKGFVNRWVDLAVEMTSLTNIATPGQIHFKKSLCLEPNSRLLDTNQPDSGCRR